MADVLDSFIKKVLEALSKFVDNKANGEVTMLKKCIQYILAGLSEVPKVSLGNVMTCTHNHYTCACDVDAGNDRNAMNIICKRKKACMRKH